MHFNASAASNRPELCVSLKETSDSDVFLDAESHHGVVLILCRKERSVTKELSYKAEIRFVVWTQCDETCRPLSSSDADRSAALRSRHREAPELRPQHGRTLHRLDLRRRPHHGGKLPGNHSLIGAIDHWRASGLCLDSIWFRRRMISWHTHTAQEQQWQHRCVIRLNFTLINQSGVRTTTYSLSHLFTRCIVCVLIDTDDMTMFDTLNVPRFTNNL